MTGLIGMIQQEGQKDNTVKRGDKGGKRALRGKRGCGPEPLWAEEPRSRRWGQTGVGL